MRVVLDYGRSRLELEVPEARLASVRRAPLAPPLPDPAGALRSALETPHDFPALRRALTPGDHVAIVVDERLPRLGELLPPVLEHIAQAHVGLEAVTLVCAPDGAQQWVEELPDQFEDVRVEVHDPRDRRCQSYLATTKQGRRIYLNRTAVDADQLVVLTDRGYDPLLGYSGAAGALYPALSDEATLKEKNGRLSLAVPGPTAWPIRQEGAEVAWLLGAPFLVQIIEGAGSDVVHVVAGSMDSAAEGQRLQDARWRVQLDEPAATVVVGVAGDPARHGFVELAQALACAARVVEDGGNIVLLTEAAPRLGAGAEILREAGSPAKALEELQRQAPADRAAAFQWASAANKAQVYLLSGLAVEVAEELFATPLDRATQVEKLLGGSGACLFLPDGHKTMAEVKPAG